MVLTLFLIWLFVLSLSESYKLLSIPKLCFFKWILNLGLTLSVNKLV